MRFDVEIEGARELMASFKLVEAGLVDLRQLGTWDAVQSVFYRIEKEIFASEGGASGKWKALSPAYAAQKAKKWGSVPILQASGRFYRSLTSSGGEAVVDKQKQELTLGSSVPYGGYHQSGTSRMPRRAPIDLTDRQEKQLLQPIHDKLKQLVANARLRELRGF